MKNLKYMIYMKMIMDGFWFICYQYNNDKKQQISKLYDYVQCKFV